MRYSTSTEAGVAKLNMTPMIDIVFQLIAFFMVVINFTEIDQDERIRLPSSQLAQPPKVPPQSPITLQLTSRGTVIFAGEETLPGQNPLLWLKDRLVRERQIIARNPDRSVEEATVIIRADRDAKIGKVQELIMLCQDVGFQKYKLRAKQRSI